MICFGGGVASSLVCYMFIWGVSHVHFIFGYMICCLFFGKFWENSLALSYLA
jgi:hypothetical protein